MREQNIPLSASDASAAGLNSAAEAAAAAGARAAATDHRRRRATSSAAATAALREVATRDVVAVARVRTPVSLLLCVFVIGGIGCLTDILCESARTSTPMGDFLPQLPCCACGRDVRARPREKKVHRDLEIGSVESATVKRCFVRRTLRNVD